MKKLLAFGIAVVVAPACMIVTGDDEPRPRVTSITPSEGPYGTTVVLHGEHLGGVTLDVAGIGAVTPSERTPTSASFRFVFPAEGPIAIVDPQGTKTPAGTFLSTWVPGPRVQRGRPLAVAQRGAETLVLTQGALVVLGDDGAREVPIAGIPTVVDAIAETRAEKTLFVLRDDRAIYTIEAAGDASLLSRVADVPSGVAVAALGVDRDGPVAVVRSSTRYTRVHAQRGAFVAEPKDLALDDPKGMAFVEGGDLLVVEGRNETPAFGDYVGVVSVTKVPSGATERVERTEIARVQDEISTVHVTRAVDKTVVVEACGLDTDPFEPSRLRCTTLALDGVRIANLGSSSAKVQSSSPPPRAGSLAGNGVVSTACADGKLTVVDSTVLSPTTELPVGTVVVEPCTSAGWPLLGADGRPRVLLDHDGALYLARPRR